MADAEKSPDEHEPFTNEKAVGGAPRGYSADEERLRRDGTIEKDNGAPKSDESDDAGD